MVIAGNMQLFPDILTGGTPFGCPLSWGEQIWFLYSSFMSFRRGYFVSIYLGTVELRSHGPIHNSGPIEYS